MGKISKILIVAVLVGLLVLVRAFENWLFYDPLLDFFKGDYLNKPLPPLDGFKLQTGIVLRFLLNTLLSLAIIWVLFRDRGLIKLSVVLYSFLFVILFLAISLIIFNSEKVGGFMVLFYVRRFLIQPIFLLILLPAFYFQKNK